MDIEENKTFRISSVVKMGAGKRLFYRFYDVYEYPSGPPKISPFYDDVIEDPFEYTPCLEILDPKTSYIRWLEPQSCSASNSSSSAPVPISSSASSSTGVTRKRTKASVSNGVPGETTSSRSKRSKT